jgi:hypothetical protein
VATGAILDVSMMWDQNRETANLSKFNSPIQFLRELSVFGRLRQISN